MIFYLKRNNKTLTEYGIENPIYVRDKKMKIKAKKSLKLEDGKHEGIITEIKFRTKPYEYTDIVIKESESEVELKLGLPTTITENSGLGLLLIEFGVTIEVDKEYDVEELLVNKKVSFQTVTEGKFSNIIATSVKPL